MSEFDENNRTLKDNPKLRLSAILDPKTTIILFRNEGSHDLYQQGYEKPWNWKFYLTYNNLLHHKETNFPLLQIIFWMFLFVFVFLFQDVVFYFSISVLQKRPGGATSFHLLTAAVQDDILISRAAPRSGVSRVPSARLGFESVTGQDSVNSVKQWGGLFS